ncbi:EXS family-domain-containing protein [Phascolomyces articulosus]|uniref:EXS family-domain-containing protein n=1 Tax=Phascolomyces articulosus TaxID=60185 RepID=A0AAD5KLK3_9FUNG|nr:EXS family-domain-containing protein [Phascolomyces articulosus]
MPFAAYLETISIPEWRKAYIDYKGLCAILELIQKEQHQSSNNDQLGKYTLLLYLLISRISITKLYVYSTIVFADLAAFYNVVSHATKEERLFFFKLDEQLNLISRFYNGKIIFIFFLGRLPIPLQYAKDDNLSYQVARGRLKRALTEFYRKLEYLQSYKEINMVGFHSILKKFERVAGWQAKKQYVEKVKQYHWASSQDLEKIMEDTVCLFANEFTCGNRVRSARCLKTMRTQKFASWIVYCISIFIVMDLDIVHRVSYIHTHLQIYACFSVPIIFTLGVSINMMVWTQCKVNYKNIFELNPRDNLDYHQFAELPCFMLLLLTLFMLFDFSNSLDPWLPSNQCPMTLFITLLTILLCPFNILYRSARYWLCRSLVSCKHTFWQRRRTRG